MVQDVLVSGRGEDGGGGGRGRSCRGWVRIRLGDPRRFDLVAVIRSLESLNSFSLLLSLLPGSGFRVLESATTKGFISLALGVAGASPLPLWWPQ